MNQSPNSITLVITGGRRAGQTFTVGERPQIIGRGSNCDILIPDKTLSRQHARIRMTPQGAMVEDLGSTNGTFVNGRPITQPTILRPGDTLRVGEHVTFKVQAQQAGPDHINTIIDPEPAAAAPPLYASPPSAMEERSNGSIWLLVGVAIVIVALLVGGGLLLLYAYREQASPLVSQPTATPLAVQVAQPTPIPTPALTPPHTATPAAPPAATPTPVPSATPTPVPLKIPGIPASIALERPAPADVTVRVDPFCGDVIEVDPNTPILITWAQQLAPATSETNYLADWLASTSYDITLDGYPITDRSTFNYYLSDGPTLNWWLRLDSLEPGDHFLRVVWYTNRRISSGLDLNPVDGQIDYFGPGEAGEGHCRITVPEPLAAATATSTPAPTSAPPTPTRPAAAQAAPLGVFQDFEQPGEWKRGDQPYGELARASEQRHSGSYAGRLSYNFPTGGNDFVVFLKPRLLAGYPNAISAWVYGDNSGHFLNIWIQDAGGETWQMPLGQIKHTGWREMVAVLDPNQPWPAGHISGPSDGLIDYPITFRGIVLDDIPDSYADSGVIYIDDLTSREIVVLPTPTPPSGPVVGTPIPSGPAPYVLQVGKHIYEPWGAPMGGDVCEAYRQHAFDDRIMMKGFNLELLLTNNATIPVPDNWYPTFITAKGRTAQVCYYGYAGSGPQPGTTSSMTFFTIVEPDDYVRMVQLTVNGYYLQICLDPSGAQSPCQ